MLFEQAPRFQGLPEHGFEVFALPHRDQRRRAIIDAFHPVLKDLGQDLLSRLNPRAESPLHAHLPRLDWPREYQPFCTWLALSREAHGYQAGPQLNLGVHADHVAARLGWDTQSDAFGRFEFLVRRGHYGQALVEVAQAESLKLRVYASADWPQGSKCIFETAADPAGSFDEVHRRGVWWELGRRYDLPECMPHVCSAAFGREIERIFAALLPVYDRIA